MVASLLELTGIKPTKETMEQVKQNYYEVDIEYTTGAKMVLLGVDEDDIRELLAREFSDIPNLNILSINIADDELVNEAKARRAFDDVQNEQHKKELN
jgi:hypothetical protein